MNVIEVLQERGFIEGMTHDEELRAYLEQKNASCYVGFDPTASSLHIGHLLPIMALAHMQKYGLRPIALVGGGTGLIGDPSGKTEMRKFLSPDDVAFNKNSIKDQLARFIEFGDNKALLVDNADWLTTLEYIAFLRDIGPHFSVNRMIKAESYKMRLDSEEGLSFIEFNYMLLQAYDFLKLCEMYNCQLQMGGSDQWGNIVAGVELIRRKRRKSAFGLTFPLITTSSGKKMGKTEKGAVWLDAQRTSPYEYYQFWVNTDDKDVARFMALFTYLPIAEIHKVDHLDGSSLNCAKSILAFEATLIAHGREEALNAYKTASSVFGTRSISEKILPSSTIPREHVAVEDISVPQTLIHKQQARDGIPMVDLFFLAGLVKSKGAARRLINQGGAYLNNERVKAIDTVVTMADFRNDEIMLRSGKKHYHKISIKS
jgi:tyrosyl-tRNA synthetase